MLINGELDDWSLWRSCFQTSEPLIQLTAWRLNIKQYTASSVRTTVTTNSLTLEYGGYTLVMDVRTIQQTAWRLHMEAICCFQTSEPLTKRTAWRLHMEAIRLFRTSEPYSRQLDACIRRLYAASRRQNLSTNDTASHHVRPDSHLRQLKDSPHFISRFRKISKGEY
jgi:hypothetical protein